MNAIDSLLGKKMNIKRETKIMKLSKMVNNKELHINKGNVT